MVTLDNLLDRLGYTTSTHYRKVDLKFDIKTAFTFGSIKDKGVAGVYFFDSDSTSKDNRLKEHPAVFIAQANTIDAAREIHRTLWNLGNVPFLVILLPNQVRIYTGFQYSQKSEDDGLLDSFQDEQVKDIEQLLGLTNAFQASSIDSGLIWKSEYYKRLDHEKRVDKKLLKNLEDLGKALENKNLPIDVCHSLIGKYVYLSYLKSRGILLRDWIIQKGINYDGVFSRNATVSALRKLVEELEEKFNGTIFPIDFEKEKDSLHDDHISLVASVFSGDEIINPESDAVRQLHLDFQAYDFSYIPVETLSAIYEQFIRNKKEEGAIYTPEVLADFVLSEMEYIKPLERNMKVFDPACGSGVFLVLAYRRLIEKEISDLLEGEKLKPQRLREVLVNSIYGVERQTDACYVTEFSLILTLLHYIEPHDLESIKFQFPSLHNKNIFNCDFFDTESKEDTTSFWQKRRQFDWITGNPPWIEINTRNPEDMEKENLAYKWISNSKNKKSYSIADYRIAEAFSWLVTELSSNDGVIGLLFPATSLFNEHSLKYRMSFFTKNDVLRITNFANLRDILFGKNHSGVLPAMTVVYRKSKNIEEKPPILHYGPFFVNQISNNNNKPWVIVINESEIKTLSPYEAMLGDIFSLEACSLGYTT
jgi:Type I restriction-modification system methyltransferase subunit